MFGRKKREQRREQERRLAQAMREQDRIDAQRRAEALREQDRQDRITDSQISTNYGYGYDNNIQRSDSSGCSDYSSGSDSGSDSSCSDSSGGY